MSCGACCRRNKSVKRTREAKPSVKPRDECILQLKLLHGTERNSRRNSLDSIRIAEARKIEKILEITARPLQRIVAKKSVQEMIYNRHL
mmetsp:Transcript_9682/g.13334  ORF Transcript_9682/g.13334 Transcript_9682/m.13334 type:complete len:89 (+) Transcript_9682:87-353(+)